MSELLIWARHKKALKKWWEARRKKPKRAWNLRPRTPEDCLDCRLAEMSSLDQWECGECGGKRTARLGTPMYGLKTSSERVALAMHLSAKGLDDAAISEVLGHSQATVARWLARSGQHSERLHEATLKDLALEHIQLDELVGKVRRWGRRVWVWAAQDAVWLNAWRPTAFRLSPAMVCANISMP